MGLDMYLTKRTYIGAEYEHRNVRGELQLTEGKENKVIPIKLNRVSYIEEAVGYWRKANQIHRWFVENVQGGQDNCGNYNVSEQQLKSLLAVCKEVKRVAKLKKGATSNGQTLMNGVWVPNVEEGKEITNPEQIAKLLPTASGFFFGSTDYDEYYMDDIDNTIEIIENVLSEKDPGKDYMDFEITYSSSW